MAALLAAAIIVANAIRREILKTMLVPFLKWWIALARIRTHGSARLVPMRGHHIDASDIALREFPTCHDQSGWSDDICNMPEQVRNNTPHRK
jgi:hypothetical protein